MRTRIGVAYQEAAPMYLMDGTSRIMISAALNASDRLSSCSKNARKHLDGRPVSVIVIDVDNLKGANDRFGPSSTVVHDRH